jgi:hypothetical protein
LAAGWQPESIFWRCVPASGISGQLKAENISYPENINGGMWRKRNGSAGGGVAGEISASLIISAKMAGGVMAKKVISCQLISGSYVAASVTGVSKSISYERNRKLSGV